MHLYHVQFDSQAYYIEAPTLTDAVVAWKKHVAVKWGDDYDGTEEPESISLVHDEAVVRATGGVYDRQ